MKVQTSGKSELMNELSYQSDKSYIETLLHVLSKAITEEINAALKFIACYDPRKKVYHNFDNVFQLVEL